jgi:hypothetical protein
MDNWYFFFFFDGKFFVVFSIIPKLKPIRTTLPKGCGAGLRFLLTWLQ